VPLLLEAILEVTCHESPVGSPASPDGSRLAERFAWARFEAPESSVPLLLGAILEVTCHESPVGSPASPDGSRLADCPAGPPATRSCRRSVDLQDWGRQIRPDSLARRSKLPGSVPQVADWGKGHRDDDLDCVPIVHGWSRDPGRRETHGGGRSRCR
jgi:hypothetical protein